MGLHTPSHKWAQFQPPHLDGHDSWYDGHLNANLTTVMVEFDVGLSIKEQLSDDEVCTSIHLLFQVLNVLLIAGAVRVSTGVA